MRRFLISAAAVGVLLGLPMLILQRWVAETRFAAIVLVLIWIAIVGVGLLVYAWRRPGLRVALLAPYAAIVAATVLVGYATGFRDERVDEQVVMASSRASDAERAVSLAGEAGAGGAVGAARPVELARGEFRGEDGHAGTGVATVVEEPGGDRVLTFTEFDVDPGVDVDVYLTRSDDDVADRIELGDLKGNVGDQQYAIPAGTDLGEYAHVVVWCKPFTVRIAVASLDG